MTAQPFKTIVLDLLQQGHRDEEAFVQELGETERTAIGTPECWLPKIMWLIGRSGTRTSL